MFDYDDVGGKIKNLAKSSFWVEAICTIVAGFIILADNGFKDGWWGILIIIGGPLVAWVASWILYGFGEIVDKLCTIEKNTSMIYKPTELNDAREKYESKIRQKKEIEEKKVDIQKRKEAEVKKLKSLVGTSNAQSVKMCPYCGENVSSNKCEMCGKSNFLFDSNK
ncbi:MAG: hypothetical protein J6D87_03220 [Clostridia bacterium]|nr:hypothetical protein [Clostridia bacterium]